MLKGHPKGLYPLFFTEMWERLGFYLMVGILILYAKDSERGGLGFSQADAAEIVGTYLAFVYFTPFLGGMIADRYLGFRRSVFFGGLLMAAGYFLLAVRALPTFYSGLILLCLGNGLFKPNISAMVGNLYEPGDPRRDAGFNIFYMGINIGATFSALFSAPIRNTYGFNAAFLVAGIGILIGVTTLLMYWKKLENADQRPEPDPDDVGIGQVMVTIILPAVIFGVVGYFVGAKIDFVQETIKPATFAFLVGMIPIVVYYILLVRRSNAEEKPGMTALMPVFIAGGAFFMILHLSAGLMTIFMEEDVKRGGDWIPDVPIIKTYKEKAMPSYFVNADSEIPRPDERILIQMDKDTVAMFGQRRISQEAVNQVSGSYPDVKSLRPDDSDYEETWDFLTCKVFTQEQITLEEVTDHGKTTISVQIEEGAEPLGEAVFTRVIDGATIPLILVTEDTFTQIYANASAVRIPPGEFLDLFNAELVTGLFNPLFVVMLTPMIVAFFAWRVRRKKEITTAKKILYGLLITTFAILIMAWSTTVGGNGESKVSAMWLIYYFLIITVGELCLSPMGLSLVTKLSPKRLVGLMMGGWFVSTAIGNKLSGFISGLPASTAMFLILAGVMFLLALFILILLPMLNRAIQKYGA